MIKRTPHASWFYNGVAVEMTPMGSPPGILYTLKARYVCPIGANGDKALLVVYSGRVPRPVVVDVHTIRISQSAEPPPMPTWGRIENGR